MTPLEKELGRCCEKCMCQGFQCIAKDFPHHGHCMLPNCPCHKHEPSGLYVDSRTPEERERDSKIKVTLTTTSHPTEKELREEWGLEKVIAEITYSLVSHQPEVAEQLLKSYITSEKEVKDPKSQPVEEVKYPLVERIGDTLHIIDYTPQEPQPVEEWRKELFNLSQTCAVPYPVDEIPEDAWVNGWFEAFGKVEPLIEKLLSSDRERVRVEERLRATKILHKYFMATSDTEVMDTIEAAQKEIFTTPQQ